MYKIIRFHRVSLEIIIINHQDFLQGEYDYTIVYGGDAYLCIYNHILLSLFKSN